MSASVVISKSVHMSTSDALSKSVHMSTSDALSKSVALATSALFAPIQQHSTPSSPETPSAFHTFRFNTPIPEEQISLWKRSFIAAFHVLFQASKMQEPTALQPNHLRSIQKIVSSPEKLRRMYGIDVSMFPECDLSEFDKKFRVSGRQLMTQYHHLISYSHMNQELRKLVIDAEVRIKKEIISQELLAHNTRRVK